MKTKVIKEKRTRWRAAVQFKAVRCRTQLKRRRKKPAKRRLKLKQDLQETKRQMLGRTKTTRNKMNANSRKLLTSRIWSTEISSITSLIS